MKEKFCFSKSAGLLMLVISLLSLFAFVGFKLSSTSTSTNSRASAPSGSADLKAYLTVKAIVNEVKGNGTYLVSIYDGSTNTKNKVTLLPQQRYVVCILNNSTDSVIKALPYLAVPSGGQIFSFVSKGTNLFEQGASGCWNVRYDVSKTYTMAGIFSPKIDGYVRKLSTPELSVNVNKPNSDLKAYLTVEAIVNNVNGKGAYSVQMYDGSTDGNKVLHLLPQQKYVVCILNNSTNKAIGILPYQVAPSFGGLKEQFFSFVSKGASLLEQGAIDGFSGCWNVRYDVSGTYTMAGIFSPKIDGYVRKLSTPELSVNVK